MTHVVHNDSSLFIEIRQIFYHVGVGGQRLFHEHAVRFEHFLLACEADMRGRTGWEEKPYPQGDALRRAFAAANEIDTSAIAAEHKNLDGNAIGEKIRQARIAAIKRTQMG